jgi:hypothetical protein
MPIGRSIQVVVRDNQAVGVVLASQCVFGALQEVQSHGHIPDGPGRRDCPVSMKPNGHPPDDVKGLREWKITHR